MKYSRERLKKFKKRVDWVEADILFYQPKHQFHLWHDRALFHFLTDENDRQKYLESLRRSLVPGGVVILSTFAIDGPGKCSGLDVVRYDQHTIRAEFGPEFDLKEFRGEDHVAPNGSTQKFNYFMFNWMPRN
ncbi:MAG: class I SAM-dependent methyltransferase [FCB group bacterium]|nr:class I SAM-dependent methyltransferase [FCB group bacterium]